MTAELMALTITGTPPDGFEKTHMLRCVSPFVTAAYQTVRLIPQGSRALPLGLLSEAVPVTSLTDVSDHAAGNSNRRSGFPARGLLISEHPS
jgi:hypothetical protein